MASYYFHKVDSNLFNITTIASSSFVIASSIIIAIVITSELLTNFEDTYLFDKILPNLEQIYIIN